MLNISKYHKLIVSCSAIATAAVSGFVQSAEAAGQLNNQAVQSNFSTTLIANNNSNSTGTNNSNSTGTGTNNSNGTGTNNSNSTGTTAPVTKFDSPYGPYYFDSNNGGAAPANGPGAYYYDAKGPNGPGYYPYQPGKGDVYFYGKGPQGLGYYSYNVNAQNGSNNSAVGSAPTIPGTIGGIGPNGGKQNGSNSAGTGGTSRGDIARVQPILSRFNAAMSKYESAVATLAAAEAGQNNASSKTSPVRYGREVADASTCGCLNTDTASAGSLGPEMVAAKEAEAAAAAELAAAKAEARTFLESVKGGNDSGGSSTFQPIW